jgi:hypothetical protein
MPATERYQTDVFAIIVVIASILVLVFLIVAAIYFNGIQNWTVVPSNGESVFLFWTSIVLGVIFLAIVIYGLYRIFTHRAVICPKPRVKQTTKVTTTTSVEPATSEVIEGPRPTIPVSNPPKAAPKPVAPVQKLPEIQKPSTPVVVGYPSQAAAVTAPKTTLQNELLNLSSAMSE